FAKNAEIQITSFDINIGKRYFNLSTSPTYLIHFYEDWEDYKNDFVRLSQEFEFTGSLIDNPHLPHYRYFSFESNHHTFNLRIDGGIAHGIKPVEFLLRGDLEHADEEFEIRKDVPYDLIYNINFEE